MFIPTLNLILVKYVYSHLTFINIKFKVTDSSPPNDTIGPLYGYPKRAQREWLSPAYFYTCFREHETQLDGNNGRLSVALHQLRCRSLNILLACPESSTSIALLRAATSVWKWNSLILGRKPLTENEIEDLISASLKK
ncbi:putative meiosis regulator and mRNA stability factor 1 [Arabidopsis thaliana]